MPKPALSPPAGTLGGAAEGRIQVRQVLRAGRLQAKLTVGHADDVHEREADRVADTVMRMPEPGAADAAVQRAGADRREALHRQPAADADGPGEEARSGDGREGAQPAAPQASEPRGAGPVCLTFDDGPQNGTQEVLDELGTSVPATFFLTGKNMARAPDRQRRLVELMLARGHRIGNHTFTHDPMTARGYREAYGDLSDPDARDRFNANYARNEEHFRALLDREGSVFRLARLPGSGRFVQIGNRLVYVEATEALGLSHVGWDFEFATNGAFGHVSHHDWQGVAGVAADRARLPRSNEIVLLHDRHWAGADQGRFRALLQKLRAAGTVFGQLTDQGRCGPAGAETPREEPTPPAVPPPAPTPTP